MKYVIYSLYTLLIILYMMIMHNKQNEMKLRRKILTKLEIIEISAEPISHR